MQSKHSVRPEESKFVHRKEEDKKCAREQFSHETDTIDLDKLEKHAEESKVNSINGDIQKNFRKQ